MHGGSARKIRYASRWHARRYRKQGNQDRGVENRESGDVSFEFGSSTGTRVESSPEATRQRVRDHDRRRPWTQESILSACATKYASSMLIFG